MKYLTTFNAKHSVMYLWIVCSYLTKMGLPFGKHLYVYVSGLTYVYLCVLSLSSMCSCFLWKIIVPFHISLWENITLIYLVSNSWLWFDIHYCQKVLNIVNWSDMLLYIHSAYLRGRAERAKVCLGSINKFVCKVAGNYFLQPTFHNFQ